MTVTRYLAHRLHQSSVSRFVRRSPLLNYFAERWWVRLHSRALLARIRGLKKPQASAPADLARAGQVPSVPTLAEAIAKLPPYVTAGEDFSSEMAKYCCTSKFLSTEHLEHSLGYQDIYAPILRHLRGRPVKVLEIGIGIMIQPCRAECPAVTFPGRRSWGGAIFSLAARSTVRTSTRGVCGRARTTRRTSRISEIRRAWLDLQTVLGEDLIWSWMMACIRRRQMAT